MGVQNDLFDRGPFNTAQVFVFLVLDKISRIFVIKAYAVVSRIFEACMMSRVEGTD